VHLLRVLRTHVPVRVGQKAGFFEEKL